MGWQKDGAERGCVCSRREGPRAEQLWQCARGCGERERRWERVAVQRGERDGGGDGQPPWRWEDGARVPKNDGIRAWAVLS